MKLDSFIQDHSLPKSYRHDVTHWYAPLVQILSELQKDLGRTVIAGISGAQGSGKSTLAKLLALLCKDQYRLNTIVLSLDDFYLTRQQREQQAAAIHPLMATRGVPGTHDIPLALEIIQKLCSGTATTLVPRFNKASDDRFPQKEWPCVKSKVDLIVLEGWCLGARPQSEKVLLEPVNELEKEHDPDASWRRYINQQLAGVYPPLFNMIDHWIMLKSPSFDCIYQWRLEQENKLKKSVLCGDPSQKDIPNRTMSASEVRHFIQHYQRITEQLLITLPDRVDTLFDLDEDRKITTRH